LELFELAAVTVLLWLRTSFFTGQPPNVKYDPKSHAFTPMFPKMSPLSLSSYPTIHFEGLVSYSVWNFVVFDYENFLTW
jgi:hypothetical protein